MQNYEFSTLVDMIWSARSAMPASILFHLFGAGHPLTIPITIALGCDTFDSASYVLFARQGRYMTETGITELRKMAYLPCSCHFCNSTSPHELLSMPREEAIRRVAFHNLLLLRKEVLGTKQAIYEGRLWDLVEQRAAAHPSLYKALTSFLRLAKFLGEGTALFKEKGIMLRGTHDNQRPEFALARQHLKEVSYKSASAAALLVSGKLKPLKKLPEYSKLAKLTKATQVDVYRIHPTLGVYPAELEFSFPFTQTVAAKKELGSKALRRALSELRKKGYRKTIILKAARRKND
jgi:7-cyano-7-deazaguanine tRNA-ribosyltransferase